MSTAPATADAHKTGGLGTSLWLVLLAISVVLFGANTAVSTWMGSRLSGASAGASDLRVLSQQLANQGREAVDGRLVAFASFKDTRDRIDKTIATLSSRYGDQPSVSEPIKRLVQTWTPLRVSADRVLASREAVSRVSAAADRFGGRMPMLQSQLSEMLRAMSEGGASSAQLYTALQQVGVASTMARRVTEIRTGGTGAVGAGESLARDAVLFGGVLDGLDHGNPQLGIEPLRSPQAQAAVRAAQALWMTVAADLKTIQDNSRQLFAAQEAAAALVSGSDRMLAESGRVFDAFSAFGSTRDRRIFPNFWWSVIGGALLLVSIGGFLLSFYRSRQREQEYRYQTQVEYNSRNQQAIMRLLDEISSLGEGDLTVKASVTEDMTGAIADAINYAVEELRTLVATINDTSVQVAASTQETQATALQLAEAANHQAEQITTASERITEIAVSIEEVSRNSADSAEVAQRSVLIATEGAGVVRETIRGMDQIRDQIQETSKRIKRLGESSQEIGSVVELINDISEQTNILALNAAVQAASAGEAGRGFAVVADEVQRLAERTSGATRRIESLVQAIQADTNEAVSSMEQTTSEVVSGARLAEDAGTALGEIERVSNDLNELIKNISGAAQQQSSAAMDITQTMGVIRRITLQTSRGAEQTAESIGHLAQLASDLRRSVADFKLPG